MIIGRNVYLEDIRYVAVNTAVLTDFLLKAEELMRKIEKEEEQISYDDPDKKVYHLCIVNLVIG